MLTATKKFGRPQSRRIYIRILLSIYASGLRAPKFLAGFLIHSEFFVKIFLTQKSNRKTLLSLTWGHLFLSLLRHHSTTDQISKYVLAAQFDFFYSNVKSMGIILEKEKQDEQPKHTPLFNLGPHFSEFSKASFNNWSNIKICFGSRLDFFYSNVKSMGIILEKKKQAEQPKHPPLFDLGPPLSEFTKAPFNNWSNIKICFGCSAWFLLF